MTSTLSNSKLAAAVLLCGSLACAYSSSGCRPANPDRTLHTGERREGLLGQSERMGSEPPRSPEGHWFFQGWNGRRITLAAESYEFDVYLRLLDPLGRQIAWGDNNGGFFNARVETVLPSEGQYTLVVSGANADQYGTYWLSLKDGDDEVDWSQSAIESYYRGGIAWGERHNSHRAASWLRLGMGQYFEQRGQWDNAEKYYSECAARAEKDDFIYCRWAVALDRGRLLARRRRCDEAVGALQGALELSKKLRAGTEAETHTLIEFGRLYYSTARIDLARVYFRTATSQAEKCGIPSTLVELYTALNEFLQSQDKEKAIDYAEKAYGLRIGLEPTLELKAIHALAGTDLFLEPKKSQEGLALATQMRDRAHRLGCPDEEVAALTLMSMAKYAANDIDGMIDLAGKAVELTSSADENPNPRRIAFQLQADGEMSRGNNQAALGWCLKALQTVESAWAREGVEDLRRELLSQSRAICTQIIRNLYALNVRHPSTEYARQAVDYAERSRSRSLLAQLLRMEEPQGLVDPQMLSRDQEILGMISAIRGQLVLLRTSSYASREALYRLQEQRARLIAERMKLQSEIRNSIGDSYRAAHLSPLAAEQVQRTLVEYYPGSVILYYQLGIQESFLIVLTPREYHFFKLPDWTTISNAVREWRLQISGQRNSLQSKSFDSYGYDLSAHRLYEILIKPAARLIQGHDLIIVPSDALCALAFEALVVPTPNMPGMVARPKYLVEQHSISYAPSISAAAEIERRWQLTSPGQQMLLLGDASDDGNDRKSASKNDRPVFTTQERLPGARQEVLGIARLARENHILPTIWLGSEANEDNFKSANLFAFRFIHIATHGISDHQDGEASALTLCAEPTGSQDGILTADEIEKLRLNSDPVVLSGCETSIGQEAGAEGIVALNRNFLLAGARCVCGSLWQVEDSWTQKLMTAFYRRHIVERFSKSHSLRLAKLKLIAMGANPSHWAPFILVGSSR